MEKKRDLIVGLGETGLSVARYFAAQGVAFDVADTRAEPPNYRQFNEEFTDARLYTGDFDADLFRRAERIVLSPGVSARAPAVQAARQDGVPIVGDVELFAQCDIGAAQVLAVTGSNGKSTVCRLLADMAIAAGRRVALGGNYGRPVLDLLNEAEALDVYVIELSSFQLETTFSLKRHIAALLNISADHLDRYDTMADYAQAKKRIFDSSGVAIFDRDSEANAMPSATARAISFGFDEPAEGHFGIRVAQGEPTIAYGEALWLPLRELPLPGRHGGLNVMAAFAVGTAAGLPQRAMVRAAREFKRLPHRFESLGRHREVEWINDSKATNVMAAVCALNSVSGQCIWLGGGSDKGDDFRLLRAALKSQARHAIVFGETAGKIAEDIADDVPTTRARTLDEAVAVAVKLMRPDDTVLLSPACASLDQYRDYRERGEHFARLVEALV